jgi:peptidoglycan hydrolase-like protein with peptidoglycan-binding domain
LALVAAVSILSASVGWVMGQRIKSPAEVAAATAPPTPSLITVPVQRQELASQVVVRAVLESNEATPINVIGSAIGTPVVTDMTKDIGDELAEGDVALEVTGRPVIVLEGILPLYRALGPGMKGPDVEQLQEALIRLGYDPGPVDGVYADQTAEAVRSLYDDRGYEVNSLLDDPEAAVTSAQDRLDQARGVLESLGDGSGGEIPDDLADAAGDILNGSGEGQLGDLLDGADPGQLNGLVQQFLSGSGQLSPEQAQQAVEAAQQQLSDVQADVGPSISRYEVVFVPSLPRRVQSVAVRVGSIADGPVMTISGAETTLNSVLSSVDRQLITEGIEAIVDDDDLGISIPARVTFVADTPGGDGVPGDRYVMQLTPLEAFPDAALNTSLRVTIPVSSTGGAVLTVPVAAVSASPNRETRVEVEIAEGETRLVPVDTGLAANGFVEIIPLEGNLAEGDRVVVGQDLMTFSSNDEGGEPADQVDDSASGG